MTANCVQIVVLRNLNCSKIKEKQTHVQMHTVYWPPHAVTFTICFASIGRKIHTHTNSQSELEKTTLSHTHTHTRHTHKTVTI